MFKFVPVVAALFEEQFEAHEKLAKLVSGVLGPINGEPTTSSPGSFPAPSRTGDYCSSKDLCERYGTGNIRRWFQGAQTQEEREAFREGQERVSRAAQACYEACVPALKQVRARFDPTGQLCAESSPEYARAVADCIATHFPPRMTRHRLAEEVGRYRRKLHYLRHGTMDPQDRAEMVARARFFAFWSERLGCEGGQPRKLTPRAIGDYLRALQSELGGEALPAGRAAAERRALPPNAKAAVVLVGNVRIEEIRSSYPDLTETQLDRVRKKLERWRDKQGDDEVWKGDEDPDTGRRRYAYPAAIVATFVSQAKK